MAPDLTVADVNRFLEDSFPDAYRSGNRCVEIGDENATARWAFDPNKLRPGEYISGPIMFGLADSALWFATFTVLGLAPMAVTTEMSIRFLRPAQGDDLYAKATLNSVGRRRLVGTVEMWVGQASDRLVAVAQGTYARP